MLEKDSSGMFSDTSPEAEKVQIELLRNATNAQRLGLALSMTDLAIRLSRRAIARANPGLSRRELDLKFVEVHYGKDLAERVREYLKARSRQEPDSLLTGNGCRG